MAYVKYSNGVVLSWDETITIGELVTSYFSGYWIVTGIEYREPKDRNPNLLDTMFDVYPVEWSDPLMKEPPIIQLTKVLNDDGTVSKRLKKCCDASYCRRVSHARTTADLEHTIEVAHKKAEALRAFLPAQK